MKKKLDPFHTTILCTLIAAMSLAPFALGDTDGPGPPTSTFPFPPNAFLPCTDPGTWTHTAGVGNGVCGRCGNKTFTRSTGSCTGDRGETHNCKNGLCSATCTYTFVSTPVGALEFTGCLIATAALLAADGACFTACGGACAATFGAACIACLAGCGAGGAAIICFYEECVEDCNYTGFMFAGQVPCCE